MRLTARAVRHRYAADRAYVLDGVDLDVCRGETVAITGPSGSGKTTLLALLGGLLAVQDGQIALVDDLGRQYATKTGVAWVPQTVNVLADRTVADNVCLGSFQAGMDRRRAMVAATRWLRLVGLDERMHDPVRVLSGGEVQRVVIARALASRRPVLLADEPTGQLDATTTESVLKVLFDRTHSRGVVVVTHDPDVARRCDRVLMLRDGRLRPGAYGRPAQPR